MKKLFIFLLSFSSIVIAMDDAKQANFCVIGNTTISVTNGDLLDQQVQAIVNPANEKLDHAGGLAAAISNQAGSELQKYCNSNFADFPIGVGNAVITSGFKLKQPYIIHAVAPNCNIAEENDNRKQLLKNAYQNTLKVAQENNIKSVAFPALGIGIFGYPKNEAAQIAVDSIKEYTKNNPNKFTEIRFTIKNDLNYFRQYCNLLGIKAEMNKQIGIKSFLKSPYFVIPVGILTLATLTYCLYATTKALIFYMERVK